MKDKLQLIIDTAKQIQNELDQKNQETFFDLEANVDDMLITEAVEFIKNKSNPEASRRFIQGIVDFYSVHNYLSEKQLSCLKNTLSPRM